MENESTFQQYKEAVDISSIFSKTDVQGYITYVNDNFCKISQYNREELIGKTHNITKDPSTPKSLYKNLWKTILSGDVWTGIIKNRKKDGSPYYVNSTIYPIQDKNGKILEFISIKQNITELLKSQELLKTYTTDNITNLPNKQKLHEVLSSGNKKFMCILLDIKNLTLLNELYGQKIGDKILLECSIKLKSYITNNEVSLYKLDPDRYVILVEDKSLFDKYKSLIEFTLLDEESFIVENIVINFNIGVAYGSDDVLNKASLALKEAKKTKNRVFFYKDSINTKEKNKQNLKKFNAFKEALLNDRVEPFFQPIVDAKTEEIVKYEALARIIDDNGNILAVEDFLDIAQKSSFFNNFTRQMIQKIFAISKKSNKEMSINITYENITSKELCDYIENKLKLHDGPTITFEILESEEIENYEVLINFTNMVKSYGGLIAIDDFGTGYSNFTHLINFRADFIKIDGSIISQILNDEKCKSIVSILVEYAKINNIKVIAEYISSEEIASQARSLDIDFFQGYFYGKAQRASFYKLDNW